MKKIIHKAPQRGSADYGWLKANYSFSFANYYNPEKIHFGALRVLNDDAIDAGMGFGTHPHDNMEIVTIVLQGALSHKDSMGHQATITPGEVQVMSAGTGVQHSEMNASSSTTKLLQIWVFPDTQNVTPRYGQKKFDPADQQNTFQNVVSPKDDNDGKALWVHQQTYFNLGNFSKNTNHSYTIKQEGNGVYIFLLEGEITIAGETLHTRDAIGLWDTQTISFTAESDSRILLIEVLMY